MEGMGPRTLSQDIARHHTSFTLYHEVSHRITLHQRSSHSITRPHKASHYITKPHKASHSITRHHTVSQGIPRPHTASQGLTRLHTASQGLTPVYLPWPFGNLKNGRLTIKNPDMICLPTNVAKTQDVPLDCTISSVIPAKRTGPLLLIKIFLYSYPKRSRETECLCKRVLVFYQIME